MSAFLPERVLVAGSGSIAQRHVRNLLALGVAEIVVLTARDVSGVPDLTGPHVSVTPAVPDDCPPVAIVANDTDRHVATARELADRGVHLLVEKPVAARADADLWALCAQVEARGLVARVAYNLRFVGALQRIASALVEGALGRPLFARIEVGQWLPDWRPNRPVTELYSASAQRGGGVALDLSHEVDYMTMLFGMPADWQVRASSTGVLGIEAPDVFDGIYAFAHGFSCTVHMDYLERTPRRRIRVVGSEGVAECDIIAGTLSITGSPGVTASDSPELFDTQRTYVAELESFFAEVGSAREASSTREAGGASDASGAAARPVLPSLAEAAELLQLLGERIDGCGCRS